MGNIFTAIFLIIAILGCVCFVSLKIERDCDEMTALLDGGHYEGAVEYWRKNEGFISIFVHDSKVDAVNAEAVMLEKDARDEKAATRMREAVEELKNTELPTAENIL